jgi:hypothetical protein
MNPIYIALPLFLVFVWLLAIWVVRHDKNIRDRHKRSPLRRQLIRVR